MLYQDLFSINTGATTTQFMKYKIALMLYKIYKDKNKDSEGICLNYDQIFMSRQINLIFMLK